MITDLDVIRACRDAQACMTPPLPLDVIRRKAATTPEEAFRAMLGAEARGLISWRNGDLATARPTEMGLRMLRDSE